MGTPQNDSPPASTDLMPKPKVIAAAAGGAIVTIGVWLLHRLAGVDEPPEVAAAEVLLVATAIAYIVPGAG